MFEDREISVKTPLSAEDLMFASMSGFDEVSRCFRFDLELASEDLEIKPEDLLGEPVTVKIGKEDGIRFFHAYVAEFGLSEIRDGYGYYVAVLRPWLWFLSTTHDNRIFQNMSVIEIVEEVLGECPNAKFEERLRHPTIHTSTVCNTGRATSISSSGCWSMRGSSISSNMRMVNTRWCLPMQTPS